MSREEYDINELVSEINFNDNFIGYQKNDIILTNKEIDILNMFDIDYKSFNSLSELLYLIDDVIDDNSSDELDEVARDISERNYYLNTRK